ncbi:unnamed protein product [Caenorhabditis angaria]|uniref:Uncharacterized protein n=1 Tax=Caenorhabditis angaria TaxID=860376 RepID=A0A9P1I4W9_9PELO|nr:unnamed protein product [Caenorhabditis angaria]
MRAVLAIFLLVVFVKSLPIEIKDIELLFPPQNTFLDSNGEYLTKIDKQIGDSQESEEAPARKACEPKQESVPEEGQDFQNSDYPTSNFNDTTPLNGTIVEDPMEVKIYKAECDD